MTPKFAVNLFALFTLSCASRSQVSRPSSMDSGSVMKDQTLAVTAGDAQEPLAFSYKPSDNSCMNFYRNDYFNPENFKEAPGFDSQKACSTDNVVAQCVLSWPEIAGKSVLYYYAGTLSRQEDCTMMAESYTTASGKQVQGQYAKVKPKGVTGEAKKTSFKVSFSIASSQTCIEYDDSAESINLANILGTAKSDNPCTLEAAEGRCNKTEELPKVENTPAQRQTTSTVYYKSSESFAQMSCEQSGGVWVQFED